MYQLLLCILLFSTQSYSLSSMQEIYSEYTFAIQFKRASVPYVSLIPAAAFYTKNIVYFSDYSSWYNGDVWQEISSVWQDFRSPIDIGCLEVPFSKTQDESLFIYYLSIHIDNRQSATYILKCDCSIAIQQIYLIPTYLLSECSLDTYKVPVKNISIVDDPQTLFSDIFGEDNIEIETPIISRSPSSGLWITIQKYGSSLLASYCSFRKAFACWWDGLQKYREEKARERSAS